MKSALKRLPLIILGVPALYFLLLKGQPSFIILALLTITLFAQTELNNMLSKGEGGSLPYFEMISAAVYLTSLHFWERGAVLAIFPALIAAGAFKAVFKGLQPDSTEKFKNYVFSLVYLPLCLGYYYLIFSEYTGGWVFIILASVWCLDIGAYITGSLLKGPKLAPSISPGKTISGAIGGAVCSGLFLFLANKYSLCGFTLSPKQLTALILVITTTAQAADLFESVLKRTSGVKDSGDLFGAHGGVLDRIDSLIFTAPLAYAVFLLL